MNNHRVSRFGLILGPLLAAGCASSQAQQASLPTPQVPAPKAPTVAKTPPQTEVAKPSSSPAAASEESRADAPQPGGQKQGGGAGPSNLPEPGAAAGATGGAHTPDEHRDALDQKLGTSLSAFDAMLLKEQQAAAQKRAEHAATTGSGAGGEGEGGTEGAAGGATAGGSSRAGGRSDDRRGETKASSPAGRDDDRSTGTSRGGEGSRGGGRTTAAAPEGEPPVPSDNVPEDVGDGRDDDVVARQIREAATKEQDPAIREKLWEEYRRYKGSRPGSGT